MIYTIIPMDAQPFLDAGFEFLPAAIYGTEENTSVLFKLVKQPLNGHCVDELIRYYNEIAPNICKDKVARKAHKEMGIKFMKRDGKYKLIVNNELREMFSLWRLEFSLEEGELYFTISDGNMPSFYDAEAVLERFCKEEIEELVAKGLIQKCDNPTHQVS